MAWTAPRTWTTGELVTAAQLNTNVRDNLNAAFPNTTDWDDWTPGNSAGLAIGNGTATGRYIQVGKLVALTGHIILGSTSTVGAGASTTFPVEPALTPTHSPVHGLARYVDASGPIHHGRAERFDTNRCRFIVDDVSGTYNLRAFVAATVPFTWTTSDQISWSMFYEVA